MNWNGVLGTVADVISKALPFVLGLADSRTGATAGEPQDVGPATLFNKAGTLQLGNFHTEGIRSGADNASPILVTFATPDGQEQSTLTVQLDFGWSFDATPWLQQYSNGTVTVGLAEAPPTRSAEGTLEGLWTFATNTVLSVSQTIQAVVNPSLTLRLQLEPNNNCVYITAIGAVAVLGTTYMLTARNTGGQTGSRSGPLLPPPTPRSGDAEFIMPLPAGVDYDDGIHDLSLQIPVLLNPGNQATDRSIRFEEIPQDVRNQIRTRKL